MTAYIGTATSRVDGRDKVTGAAKYAGEFGAPDLVFASVVTSTIAKGRIARIDLSEAMMVGGVIAVLTHKNRPPMADNDEAYKDDVAPEGSPFRPLYDERIHFSGQPIALVLAEASEIARFAASLLRVDYDEEPHVTDLYRARDDAFALDAPAKPRGDAARAFAAADVRHDAEYYIPIEHHNPMEPYASTVLWDGGGKLTVYDKTQGVQNVQRYICGIFGMKPEDVRVMSAFVGGAFGSGLRPQYQVVLAVLAARALQRSVRVVLTRQQMYGLGYRPAMIQRIRLGAKADGTLDAITHRAITVTSQFEDFHRHETTWSGLLYASATAAYAHGLARLDLATCAARVPPPASMRSNPPWMNWPSPSSSIRWSCACDAIRTAIRTVVCLTAARTCANATARARKRSAGANATPSRARCATAATWSAGAWRAASGRRCR
jgi:xanthine dehydrogenase YagR molybdenum-binding subunit